MSPGRTRGEVAAAGAYLGAGLFREHLQPSPGAIGEGVRRYVPQAVLALQLGRDLLVHPCEIPDSLGSVGDAPALPREHVELVLRVPVLVLREVLVGRAERDRIDHDAALSGLLLHVFEAEDRLGVVAVGENYDGPSIELFRVLAVEIRQG